MRDDMLRVADMRECLERVRSFVSRGRASFFEDAATQAAVAYEILKLGEAASHVTAPFRKEHGDVPWTRIVRLRNKIVHEYFRIDIDDLWTFVDEEMPKLEKALRGM